MLHDEIRASSRRNRMSKGPSLCLVSLATCAAITLIVASVDAFAQCAPPPYLNTNGIVEGDLGTNAQFPSVAVDDLGRFIIAYQTTPPNLLSRASRAWVYRFSAEGQCLCTGSDACPAEIGTLRSNTHLSAAMADDPVRGSDCYVAWIEAPSSGPVEYDKARLFRASFGFDASPFSPPPGTYLPDANTNERPGDVAPTAATGGGINVLGFSNHQRNCTSDCDRGLVHARNSTASITQIEDCAPLCDNFERPVQWMPSVAADCGGYYTVAYARPEEPLILDTQFDIVLELHGPGGVLIGAPIVVNQSVSGGPTDEVSASVAMDCNSNIVVAWAGPSAVACGTNPIKTRVYLRRFRWDGTGTTAPYPVGDQFVAQCYDCEIGLLFDAVHSNPTVALSNDPNHKGRFVVAWNTNGTVRARLYESDGAARGTSFRVNQLDEEGRLYEIAESAQHTIQYARDGRIICAYTDYQTIGGPDTLAKYTIFKPEFVNLAPGRRGDCNYDDRVDGDDIPVFVNKLISSPATACNVLPTADRSICGFDCNLDGSLSTADVPYFVCLLLNGEASCTDVCGNPATTVQDGGAYSGYGGGGEQMAMGGGESMMGSESGGSTWEPWFTWTQVRNFAQWLKVHPRSAHPELTDIQYYHLLRQAMKDIGLWRE